MKLHELFESQEDAALRKADEEIDELEEAYEEIALLKEVFDAKDFGVLIGKKGRMFSINDIREIKRKLSDIIRNNPIIDGDEVSRGRDGDEKLRLLAQSIKHGFELTVLGSLTGLLSTLAVTTGPIGAVFAGAGALLTGGLTKHQYTTMKSLSTLSKLMNIVDSYGDLNPKSVKRSGIKKFMDFLMRKSPKEIEKEMERKVKRESEKAQRKFQKQLRGFPKYVKYKDGNEIKEYPVANLFDI